MQSWCLDDIVTKQNQIKMTTIKEKHHKLLREHIKEQTGLEVLHPGDIIRLHYVHDDYIPSNGGTTRHFLVLSCMPAHPTKDFSKANHIHEYDKFEYKIFLINNRHTKHTDRIWGDNLPIIENEEVRIFKHMKQ